MASVPGFGKQTAQSFTVELSELGTLNRKQIACMQKLITLLNSMVRNKTPWQMKIF